jgi:hypothetical protein
MQLMLIHSTHDHMFKTLIDWFWFTMILFTTIWNGWLCTCGYWTMNRWVIQSHQARHRKRTTSILQIRGYDVQLWRFPTDMGRSFAYQSGYRKERR